jgi:hypothetical protein
MRRTAFVTCTLLLASTASLFGAVGPTISARAADPASCYPNNEFKIRAGNFTAKSSGEGTGEAEIELGSAPRVEQNGVQLVWAVNEAVTKNGPATPPPFTPGPTGMSGSLTVKVNLHSPYQPVSFVGRCVAEAQLDQGGVEVEFEGTAYDFPGRPRSGTPAVGSLTVHKTDDGQHIVAHVSIELGTTCNEGNPEFEVNAGTNSDEAPFARATLNSSTSTGEPGRAGLPAGVTPGPTPCPGVRF